MNIKAYPVIIVEQPHQRKPSAWVAASASDITDQLHESRYGDNWNYTVHENREAAERAFGPDEIPADLLVAGEGDGWPMAEATSPFGDDYHSLATMDDQQREDHEVDFALEYIGHDLRALHIVETQAEADDLMLTHPALTGAIKTAIRDLAGLHGAALPA